VVLSTTAATEAHVDELADVLRAELSGTYDVGGVPVSLGASVGSTWGPMDDIEQLLRNADARMYTNKARRRGEAESVAQA
jgi:predicted signal transduction protein with EAL and GGDEF domain